MQLFGILLVLNRKSRLGRQHIRASGTTQVRGPMDWSPYSSPNEAFFHKASTTASSKSCYFPLCLHGNHAAATRARDVWQESLWSVLLCEMHLITNWQTNPVRHPCSVHCTYKVLHRTTLCSTGLLKFRDIFWLVDLGLEETTTIRFQLC
jgi:hypothetical protein